jgi:hypothetical protein
MSIPVTKLVTGAMALAFAGGAMANTNINATTTGDLFLNIVNTSNNTSYLFDTGISQATFGTGTGSYSFNLSTDTNLTAFLAEDPASDYYYSVVSATRNPTAIIDITGNIAPTGNSNTNTVTAQTAISAFLVAANGVSPPTTSTTSQVLVTADAWNQALTEGVVSRRIFNNPNPPYSDQAGLNTALAFYTTTGATSSAFAYTWDFTTSNDTLAYNPQTAPVPLPAPILLLASALGLMGVVSRRNKAAA